MFCNLEEQMKHDDALATSPRERVAKWTAVAFAAVVVFGGLYYAIQLLS